MWTARIPVAFPESLLAEANQLAAIIDPDTGGALTFSSDQIRGGYLYAEIPLMSHFEPVVRERDPDTWQAVLASLADEKGVERLDPEVVETLRAAMLFGAEECAVLDPT
ncbi:MAG: hypothetical protein KBE53_00930 [Chromatiaceae bacterium]|nr:hypothetical protein [Chromatiaceae bacterium]